MRILKISAVCLACAFALSFSLPAKAFASRSTAGGGKTDSFDAGTFAVGTAIGVASSVAGSAASSAISSGGNLSNFSAMSALGSWGNSYASNLATGQLSYGISAMGNYYGWGGQAISGISSLGTGLGSGLISGSPGAIPESIVKSGIIYAASNSKGEYSPWVGLAAGMAGDFAGGSVSKAALGDLVQGIPSHLLSIAASEMTEGKGMMDRYVINQAFSGAYNVTGSLGSLAAHKLDLNTSYETMSSGVKQTKLDGAGRNWLGLRTGETPEIEAPVVTGKGDTNATIRTTTPSGLTVSYPEYPMEQLPSDWEGKSLLPISVKTYNINPPLPMILPQAQEAATSQAPAWNTPQWQYESAIRNGASPEDARTWSGYSLPQSTAQQVSQPLPAVSQPYPALSEAYLSNKPEYPVGFNLEEGGYKPSISSGLQEQINNTGAVLGLPGGTPQASASDFIDKINTAGPPGSGLPDEKLYQVKAPVGLIRPLEFKPNISPPSEVDAGLPVLPVISQSLFNPAPVSIPETVDSFEAGLTGSRPSTVEPPSQGLTTVPVPADYSAKPKQLYVPLRNPSSFAEAPIVSPEGEGKTLAPLPVSMRAEQDVKKEQYLENLTKQAQDSWGERGAVSPVTKAAENVGQWLKDSAYQIQHPNEPPAKIRDPFDPATKPTVAEFEAKWKDFKSPGPVNFFEQNRVSPSAVSPNQPAVATVVYDPNLAPEGGSWVSGQPIYKEGTDKVLYELVPRDYNGPETRFPIYNSVTGRTDVYVRSNALERNDADAEAFNWGTLPIKPMPLPVTPEFASRDSLAPPLTDLARTPQVMQPSETLTTVPIPGYDAGKSNQIPIAVTIPPSAPSSFFEPTQSIPDASKPVIVTLNNAAAEIAPGNYDLTTTENDPKYGIVKHGPLKVTLDYKDGRAVVYQGDLPVGSVNTILPKEPGSVLTLTNPSSGKVYTVIDNQSFTNVQSGQN